MKIRLSEIFTSFQGEGRFTGMPTIFVRFFGCNLKCDGFGQKDPTDPNTFVLPYKTIDVKPYTKMKDLPVFPFGCDSSYSWDSKFKKFAKDYSKYEVADEIIALGKNDLNIDFVVEKEHRNTSVMSWQHNVTGNHAQLCFTGGEPLLHQSAINAICLELYNRNACPPQITIETNATKSMSILNIKLLTHHLHMSCSPKLFAVSGEKNAINYDVIEEYSDSCDSGAIKFVHNGTQKAWDEIDEIMSHLKYLSGERDWSFWIMPVGSTLESQEPNFLGNIATEAIKRGFNISHRAHISVFGNKIGT